MAPTFSNEVWEGTDNENIVDPSTTETQEQNNEDDENEDDQDDIQEHGEEGDNDN